MVPVTYIIELYLTPTSLNHFTNFSMSHQPHCIVRSIHSSLSSNLLNDHWWQHIPGNSAANHYEEWSCYGFASFQNTFCSLGRRLLRMQLHTGAEHFGNIIFQYSEFTSQYHIDASIDVYHTLRACDKTIVSQIGTVAKRNGYQNR